MNTGPPFAAILLKDAVENVGVSCYSTNGSLHGLGRFTGL
jgi:hypothetical protein